MNPGTTKRPLASIVSRPSYSPRPAAMLNLNEVGELRGFTREHDALRLGSGLTYSELEHGLLRDAMPALAEASRTVGSPQIRNRGTIGGNLATASPAGDALPPLLVCGGDVRLTSVRGDRSVSVQDFLVGPKRTLLEPDELIAGVSVSHGPSGSRQTFL